MQISPLVVSLPTADRRRAYDFYRAWGFDTPGELADDGVPEPLVLALNDGVRVMFVPTGGFGWILGERMAAPAGTSECVLSLAVPSSEEVDRLVARAVSAGAVVVTAAGDQAWGYSGTVTDPDGHLWIITSAAVFC